MAEKIGPGPVPGADSEFKTRSSIGGILDELRHFAPTDDSVETMPLTSAVLRMLKDDQGRTPILEPIDVNNPDALKIGGADVAAVDTEVTRQIIAEKLIHDPEVIRTTQETFEELGIFEIEGDEIIGGENA